MRLDNILILKFDEKILYIRALSLFNFAEIYRRCFQGEERDEKKMCVCVCVRERGRKRERDQNMVLNLLRHHHRDK